MDDFFAQCKLVTTSGTAKEKVLAILEEVNKVLRTKPVKPDGLRGCDYLLILLTPRLG